MIRGAARRQRPELRPLDIDQPATASVGPADDFVNELPIGSQVFEVGAAAEQERLRERGLEMPVRGLDRAVLVRDARPSS